MSRRPITLTRWLLAACLAPFWSIGAEPVVFPRAGRAIASAPKEAPDLPRVSNARDCALEQWRRLPRAVPVEASVQGGSIAGSVWMPLGPNPISELGCCGSTIAFQANGRVNSIAVDPSDTNRIYLGSAGGGVWRSEDNGSHWRPLTDQQISLGIGSSHAIAIDPNHPKTIYAGTTSFALLAQSLPRRIDYTQSKGVLKSTDSGESWIVLGSGVPTGNDGNALSTFENTDLNTIIVDPANSDVLYAAAGRSATGGLFRSEDGGSTWTAGGGGSGFAESLVLDTSSPSASRVLYAGMNGQGVLRSADGGSTWSPVLTPATVAAAFPNGFNKVIVALAPTAAPPNPAGQVVYVSLLDAITGIGKIYENANGGAPGSWVPRNSALISPRPAFPNLGGSPFSDMVVDPASPGDGINDLIYWGGFTQFLSGDSGNSFAEIGQIHGTHGDHQTWLVVQRPSGPSVVFAGDDGGIWKSVDQGATWTGTSEPGSPPTINAGGLQTSTLYALAVKQDATASVTLGGAQDSGVLRSAGTQTWTGTSNDGIDVLFDGVSLGVAYCIQNATILRSSDSGATWPFDLTPNVPIPFEIGIFSNRLGVDPNNAGYLYVGGSQGSVFQSLDFGASFRTLSPGTAGAYVSSIDVAPGDSAYLAVAAGSRVFVTTHALDASVTFDELAGLPARFVTRVAFDPADPTVLLATVSGLDEDSPGRPGHVFRTTIGGTSWTDISPFLNVPVNSLAIDGTASPSILYVGTDLGVLRSADGGSTWEVVDDLHLPNAAVSDLAVNIGAGVLRAATWGRGVFELAAPSGPVILVTPGSLEFGETCAVGADRTIDVTNIGSQPLTVSGVQRLLGSASFTVFPSPQTPLILDPGAHAVFTVRYVPASPATPESASIRISSNDPGAPYVDLTATGSLETTPPEISAVTPTPAVLRPPNHKMRMVALAVDASDNCEIDVGQSCRITSISSNEPVEGTGDGDTAPDWEITGNLTARLRAERAGNGPGRAYTLKVECTDSAGNSSTRDAVVTVPHD